MSKLKWSAKRVRDYYRELLATRRTYTVTREGWLFVVVTLVIGLAALNTAAQLLFLIFALMCSFWTLSAVLATASMRGLQIERSAPWIATAATPVAVELTIRNRKKSADSHSLRVIDQLRDDTVVGASFFVRVGRVSSVSRSYECMFPRRGRYEFGDITIATRFPFGLIERTMTRKRPREVVILPRTIDAVGILQSARVDLGDQEVNIKGRGSGLFGIRAYIPGESARDIHWRVTARTGTLMTREYETEEKRRASILIDNRLGAEAGSAERERFEQAIVLAGSLAGRLLEQGHQVELLTADGKVAFGMGPAHLRRCLRALAMLEARIGGDHGPLPHEPAADSVQIVVRHTGREALSPDAVGVSVHEHRQELAAALAGPEFVAEESIPGVEQLV